MRPDGRRRRAGCGRPAASISTVRSTWPHGRPSETNSAVISAGPASAGRRRRTSSLKRSSGERAASRSSTSSFTFAADVRKCSVCSSTTSSGKRVSPGSAAMRTLEPCSPRRSFLRSRYTRTSNASPGASARSGTSRCGVRTSVSAPSPPRSAVGRDGRARRRRGVREVRLGLGRRRLGGGSAPAIPGRGGGDSRAGRGGFGARERERAFGTSRGATHTATGSPSRTATAGRRGRVVAATTWAALAASSPSTRATSAAVGSPSARSRARRRSQSARSKAKNSGSRAPVSTTTNAPASPPRQPARCSAVRSAAGPPRRTATSSTRRTGVMPRRARPSAGGRAR